MSEDPFRPIDASARAALRVVKSAEWEIVLPAPIDVPAPAAHPKLGQPSRRWAYNSANGALLGYICRFDPPGGKEFRPLAYWRSNGDGAREWRWAAWPAPRPLYSLDRLAERPDARVIVTEGEKSADAAARLFPNFAAVCSPNGSKSAAKADWSPLKGRDVLIWPDADAPGDSYAKDVARLAGAAGARSVAVVIPPLGVVEGFDLADAEAEGWASQRLGEMIKGAKPVNGPQGGGRKSTKNKAEDESAPRRKRGVEELIDLVDSADCEFWHGPDKTAYVTVPMDGHLENYRVVSREFARWLSLKAFERGSIPPSKSTIEDSLRLFEMRAISKGRERRPWLRVGAGDGRWFVDLGDENWRVVQITPNEWQILDTHDCPMIRSSAMTRLPSPSPFGGEGVDRLRDFVKTSDDGFKMIVAWLLAALWPRGPWPILILNGEHGSAKTTISRMLRSLVDPNVAPVRTMPKDETDLIVSARNAHVIAIDNVSSISSEMSDALCRVATGGGFSSRVKYSDGEEFVVYTKNPILLNGIPSLANRPDLASRALVVRLDAMPDSQRKSEEELEAEWESVAPVILSGLFDALSTALANLPSVKLAQAARMADFERLVEAAAPALSWGPGEFASVYRGNREELDASAIEADPVASAIISFVAEDYPSGWAGTATRLLELLSPRVSEGFRRSRAWPDSAVGLSNKLERAKPLLRRHGLTVSRKHSGERTITITPVESAKLAPEVMAAAPRPLDG